MTASVRLAVTALNLSSIRPQVPGGDPQFGSQSAVATGSMVFPVRFLLLVEFQATADGCTTAAHIL
jgi:hypothetical protein